MTWFEVKQDPIPWRNDYRLWINDMLIWNGGTPESHKWTAENWPHEMIRGKLISKMWKPGPGKLKWTRTKKTYSIYKAKHKNISFVIAHNKDYRPI
jgi:hypothetical protein